MYHINFLGTPLKSTLFFYFFKRCSQNKTKSDYTNDVDVLSCASQNFHKYLALIQSEKLARLQNCSNRF
jgi:hypothetical protein